MFDSIFPSSTADIKAWQIIVALGVALATGIILSLVSYFTQRNKLANRNMSQTMVILPMLVTIIIMLVGSNMARAISLGGAFAIIRFRSNAGPKDLSYVLASMGVGLACGVGYVTYAGIVAVIFSIVMIVISLLKYGEDQEKYRLLKIKVPENLNSPETFEEIIRQYASMSKLLKIKTADLGSVYELHYVLRTKKGINEKAFIDDLRIHNGNLTIALLAYSNDFEE